MQQQPKKKEIEFNAGALLERVEGFATGKESFKEVTIKLPAPVKPIAPNDIRKIRMNLGFTQAQFAQFLNVPKITAASWKNGTAKGSG